MGNCIDFENTILKNKNKNKGEPKVHYILMKYKKKESYDTMSDMSENFTLFQFMNYLGDVNHAISVVGYWIFDSI